MALRIRLRRVGRKKLPVYRIVVAEALMPRDGRYVESIGFYNPRTEPLTVEVDREKARYWISKGALPTETVEGLFKRAGIYEEVSAVEGVASAVTGAVSAAAGAVAHAASAVAGGARDAVGGVASAVRGAVGRAVDAVEGAAGAVVDRVRGDDADDNAGDAANPAEGSGDAQSGSATSATAPDAA